MRGAVAGLCLLWGEGVSEQVRQEMRAEAEMQAEAAREWYASLLGNHGLQR